MNRKNILMSLLFFLSGCWYSFTEKPYPDIKSIAIVPFSDATGQYELAPKITSSLNDKLSASSAYSVSNRENADAFLSGEVVSYTKEIYTYDQQENPQEYRIRILVKVKFEKKDGRLIWEHRFEGFAVFPVDGEESKASDDAIQNVAELIYLKLRGG